MLFLESGKLPSLLTVDVLPYLFKVFVLSMLRSIGLDIELFVSGRLGSVVFACEGVDT